MTATIHTESADKSFRSVTIMNQNDSTHSTKTYDLSGVMIHQSYYDGKVYWLGPRGKIYSDMYKRNEADKVLQILTLELAAQKEKAKLI